ncbi:MAG: DUF1295 domain-containing protein [Alphaproteobacteria bacterium]|nr:DUF1295 domain-containing protein [Alphaproteobacteria bacterium]
MRKPPLPLMMPPPILFALTFAAGALIQWLAGAPPRWTSGEIEGFLVLGVAFVFSVVLVAMLLSRRTTLNPFGKPSAFVASGAYRFSRNPMYLALILIYLGGVLAYGSLWPLLLIVFPVMVLDRVVVPYEEQQLTEAFGETYSAYSAKVRRWL